MQTTRTAKNGYVNAPECYVMLALPILFMFNVAVHIIKVKVMPRQAEVAQGVQGRLRPQIILTFRLYKGGSSSTKSTGRLYPKRYPWHSLSEAESISGLMVLSGVPRKKSPVTQLGIDPGTVRLVVQRLNHYATGGVHNNNWDFLKC